MLREAALRASVSKERGYWRAILVGSWSSCQGTNVTNDNLPGTSQHQIPAETKSIDDVAPAVMNASLRETSTRARQTRGFFAARSTCGEGAQKTSRTFRRIRFAIPFNCFWTDATSCPVRLTISLTLNL